MPDTFTLEGLAAYGARQWRWMAVACLVAAGAAGAVSLLLLPRKYTAVTRLIVEPGPASPLRNASSQSPQMLAMLGGYEQMVRNGDLFAEAASQLGAELRPGDLSTRVMAQPRVIEIRFTHTNPKKALEIARWFANQAVSRSNATRRERWEQLAAEAGNQADGARAWAAFRGEYVRVFDTGSLPREPSTPRTVLHVMSAALLAVVLSAGVTLIRYAAGARA